MMVRKTDKKTTRLYKTDTFKAHQEAKVGGREQAIHGILELLGKSEMKFQNITSLAEHVSEMLSREGDLCHCSTLVRKHHTKDGVKVLNRYRHLLHKYELGKYFGKGKNQSVTAEDIGQVRTKYPAVDAYCALKEGETKNLQEQVKLLTSELGSSKGSAALPQGAASAATSDQLNKTLTALKRLLDITSDFFEIDWKKRAIVDLSHRDHPVVVEPDLLDAFFMALEKSGMKPLEEK
jgi:hypothetical protein